MNEQLQPAPVQADLQAEITRLNKIIQSLMNRAERNASIKGSDFNLFQTTITLDDQVRLRTKQLEAALQENEKINRALRESENNYRLLIENSPVSIHEIDLGGKITSMSKEGLRMHEVKEENEILGTLYVDEVNITDRERIAELLARAYAGEICHFEFKIGKVREKILKSCFVPIKDTNASVKKIMGITEDITERKKAEELVHDLAFHDTLTHLPNRRLLHERQKMAMDISKRSGFYGAVMFLDLDNFKPLNDEHGHETGDLLLIKVAHRISACVRKIDTVARFGGDEFVVMLSQLNVDMGVSATQAAVVAERIRVELAKPYLLQRVQEGGAEITVEHHCTASIGVELFVNHDLLEEDILKFADIAMYQAKTSGRNKVVFYDHNQQGD